MRCLVALSLLLNCLPFYAQAKPAPAIIAARQPEVIQLGKMLYRVDLSEPDWKQQIIFPCPAFIHHAFAKFEARDVALRNETYLAIFNLEKSPARSIERPWEGGVILLRLHHEPDGKSMLDENNLVSVFNQMLRGEVISGKGGGDRLQAAKCFAAMTGEVLAEGIPDSQGDLPFNVIFMGLVSPSDSTRTLRIKFAGDGSIQEASIRIERPSRTSLGKP